MKIFKKTPKKEVEEIKNETTTDTLTTTQKEKVVKGIMDGYNVDGSVRYREV